MRAIKADIAENRLDDVPAQIRSMKRLWQNDANLAGLVASLEAGHDEENATEDAIERLVFANESSARDESSEEPDFANELCQQ